MHKEIPEVSINVVLDFILPMIDVELREPIPDLLLDQILQNELIVVANLLLLCPCLIEERGDVLD